MNFFLGVLGLKKQKLGSQKAGAEVLNRTSDEDNPLLQKTRIYVIGALAAGGLFDHHRNQRVHVNVARVGHRT